MENRIEIAEKIAAENDATETTDADAEAEAELQNVSINNGNSYITVGELTDEQVHEVYERLNPSDEARWAGEDASAEFPEGVEAERAYIAAVAKIDGDVVIG